MTIEAASRRTTDEILDRALLDSGNQDPKRVEKTGKLHYDAFASLEGLVQEHHHHEHLAVDVAEEALVHVLEHAGIGVGAGVASAGSAVVMMVGLGKAALYDAWAKADARLAQGASDAGVVAIAHSLPFDPKFVAAVDTVHTSVKAGERAAAQLRSDAHTDDRAALRLRADRGFDKAAGYALNAAKSMAPIVGRIEIAAGELAAAKAKGDKAAIARLSGEIDKLAHEVQKLERLYFAPIEKDLRADAAVGLGAQYALFHAMKVARGEETIEQFRAIHAKARDAVTAAMPDARDTTPRRVPA